MTKLTRLSLVAAVAVAGLTNVNAASLEEAIKGIDVSGKVYVETVTNTTKGSESLINTDIDADITFKSKVNDNITAVVTVQADVYDEETDTMTTTTPAAPVGNATKQDVTVDNVYFNYTNGPLSVNAGKQFISTPITDGEIGTGAVALYNAGIATLAAAHYYDNDGITNSSITSIAALGTVGPVNAELHFTNISGESDTTTVAASTKLASVALKARHAMTSYDTAGIEDGATTRIDASTSVAGIALSATYLNTDDKAAYTTSTASANTYELSQLGVSNQNDVDLYAAGASYTMNDLTYSVDYAAYDEGTNTDADELRLRATYKMSKNFTVMGTYSMYEKNVTTSTTVNNVTTTSTATTDTNSARLDAKYTF